jgi:hypothetical protein
MSRKALLLFALLVPLAVTTDSPADVAPGKAKKEPAFSHVVFFKLKPDAPAGSTEALLADCHDVLAKIPSVRSLRAGRPAEKAEAISIKDFHVGLSVWFDDYDGLKEYLDHPQHKKFVEKHGKAFDKVLVYDFVNQTK